jgi:hypothetical protein
VRKQHLHLLSIFARLLVKASLGLVEPGYGPTTAFTSNGGSRMAGLIPEAYAPFAEPIFAAFAQPAAVTTEADVAEVVWRTAQIPGGSGRRGACSNDMTMAGILSCRLVTRGSCHLA